MSLEENKEKLRTTIMHLYRLESNIGNCFNAIETLRKSEFRETHPSEEYTIISAVILFTSLKAENFFEEYFNYTQKLLQESERGVLDEYANKARKEFPGLRDLRNQAIAHGFRNKKKESVYVNDKLPIYGVPQTFQEWKVLFDLISEIMIKLEEYYPKFFADLETIDEQVMKENGWYRKRLR